MRPLKIESVNEEFFNECLAKDKLHQQLGLNFKDVVEENTEAFLISDETGPLMTVRLHNALRVAIQFDPSAQFRSAKAARDVIRWFSGIAKDRKAKEVIIRAGGKSVHFADRLGFEPFEGQYIKV